MSKTDWKYVGALALGAVFSLGAPWLLLRLGVLAVPSPSEFLRGLTFFYLLLGIRVMFRASSAQDLRFVDHGFELALLAFAGFLTTHVVARLHSGTLRSLASGAFDGLVFALFLTLLTAFIAARAREGQTKSAALLRGLNYVLGAIGFASYEVVIVSGALQP